MSTTFINTPPVVRDDWQKSAETRPTQPPDEKPWVLVDVYCYSNMAYALVEDLAKVLDLPDGSLRVITRGDSLARHWVELAPQFSAIESVVRIAARAWERGVYRDVGAMRSNW